MIREPVTLWRVFNFPVRLNDRHGLGEANQNQIIDPFLFFAEFRVRYLSA